MVRVQARARASITHCQANHTSLAMATAWTARAQRTVFQATPAVPSRTTETATHGQRGPAISIAALANSVARRRTTTDASHGPPQRATGQQRDQAQGGANDDHHAATVP